MEKKHLNEANRYTSRNNRRRLWQRIVGALGCMVVFVTTYVLILPAITMEADCGNTEHTHAESCYSQVLSRQVTQLQCTAQVHTHTADCTDAEGTTVCGYADYLAHTHSGLCYDAAGGLLCAIQENEVHEHTDACYEAVKLHEHTDACYTEEKGELTCTVAEGEGAHAHSGACYEAVTQTICGQEEAEGHTHGDACLDESGALACGLEETAGHTHDASCVNTTSTLVCQQEETPGHRHEDACYAWTQVESCGMTGGEPETAEPTLVCGKKEVKLHTHTDACIDAEGKVVCGAVEVLEHSHSEDCLVTTEAAVDTTNLTCGLEEGESHTHAERCYGTWELSCGLAEHTHTDECYSDVEETTAPTTEPTEAEEETLSEEDYGISLWALLPEEEVDGGTVPNSEITWRITVNDAGEYTLYLDGEGAIPDNPDSSEIYSPWYGYRSTEMKIVFGEGITSTGQRTFQNMIVSGIDFGGVETIGKAAFSGIRTNYDITIPGTVKTIEGSAFSVSVGSYRKSIYLSEGTETIGQSAFGSHEWAIPTPQVFYIPSTVSSIGLYFNYAVSEFDVAEDNPYYCDVDGVLYTKDMTTLVCFPAYMQIDEFTIPASVTKVSTGAFQNAHVKKLIIPDTVTSLPAIGGLSNAIEEIVFDDDFIFSNGRAVSLTSYPMKRLHLPENTTYSIRSLFSMYYSHGTSMIESIKIPKGVTSIREFTEDQPEWVRMPNLKEVIYDAQNATLDTLGINGLSVYELTIGANVDNLPVNFTYIAKQASAVYFEPNNAFTAEAGAFAGTFMPLEALSGTLYADAQGALYSYDAATKTAKLVYVSPGITNLTVPAAITPEEGLTCAVNSVGQDTLRQACDLTAVTFANPDGIISLEAYAMANCPTLESVNGKITVEEAEKSILARGSNVFYNTGLEGSSGFDPEDMDGDPSLKFEEENVPTMHITVKSETGTWTGEEGSGGYQLLTGDSLTSTITVGNTEVQTTYDYRVYFRTTSAEATLSITPGTTYTYDGQDAVCYATEDPYTVYLQFVPAEGVTASIPVTATYPSPTSPGGGLTVWGVVQTAEAAAANAGKVVSGDSGSIQAFWTTQPEDFTLTNSIIRNQKLGISGDGEGGAYPNNNLEYRIKFARTETETSAYGKDYVTKVDLTETLTLPEGVSWNEQVQADIKAGNVTLSGNYFYAGDICVASLGSGTNRTMEWDEATQSVKLSLTVLNNLAAVSDISNFTRDITIYKEALSVDMDTLDQTQTNQITGTVTATIHHTHKPAVTKTAEVSHNISGGAGSLSLSMVTAQSGTRYLWYGESETFIVTVQNPGGESWAYETESVCTMEVPLQANYYITPANIQRMLDEEYGADLTVTITNALVGSWTQVTAVDGTVTAWQTPGNSDTGAAGNTLEIRKGESGYTVAVNGGTPVSASTVAGALQSVGYAVNGNDSYSCSWNMNAEDETFTLDGGEVRKFNVYFTVRDTLQFITADWPQEYNGGASHNVRNYCYLWNAAGKEIKRAGHGNNVNLTPEVSFSQSAYNSSGADISKDLQGEDGEILTYKLYMTHLGSGSYQNLPMVANISGSQYLLVSKADNPQLADQGLEESGDCYKLKAGTYSNVVVGIDDEGNKLTAATVTVTAGADGLNTQIKWYFVGIEGGNYQKIIDYRTQVDLSITGKADYSLGSSVTLNDCTDSRLVTPGLVGGGTTFNREKSIVTTVGAAPEEDVLDADGFSLVGSGGQVTYRVTYRNVTEDQVVRLTGNNFAEALPDTLGTYDWEKGTNVTGLRVVTEGEATSTGMDDWDIGTNYYGIQGDRQYMMWPETSAIVMQPGSAVHVYYTITFPVNTTAEDDAWDIMADSLVGESLYNDSYYLRYYSRVEHMLQEPGSVVLQKGVYGQYYNQWYGMHPTSTRVYYNNPEYVGNSQYMNRYIAYYVTLYNGGNARLYLNEIQDQLPDGFTYLRLFNKDSDLSGSVFNIVTPGGYGTVSNLSSVIDSEEVTFRSAKVSANITDDSLSFTFGAGSGDYAVSYDENRGQYYLGKGEAITFRYVCTIGKVAETADTSTNTISMPYTNYLEAGVDQIRSTELPITAPASDSFTDYNDGSRLINISGGAYTLVSEVDVVRGAVVPGVIKNTASYYQKGSTESTVYGGSVGPEDTVNWKVQLHNDGMLVLTNYKFIDIMPAPYVFEGSVDYIIKDASGTNVNGGTLFIIPERTAEDTTLTLIHGVNKDAKTTLTIGSPDPIRVGGGNLIVTGWKGQNVNLWLGPDENGNEVMTLEFTESLAIPEGGYIELSFSSRNASTTYQNKVYTNQAQLIPTVQTFDTVGQGSALKDDAGNLIGAKNYSSVNVSYGYATTSSVTVTQDGNSASSGYILVDKDSGTFRYSLNVGNTKDNAMTKLVIIDNLPQIGDHSPFDTATPRGSEYCVSLADEPNLTVTVTDKDGNVTTLDPSDYTVQYSTGTNFGSAGSADWKGEQTGTFANWTGDSTGARSLRVIIDDDTGTLIPKEATVSVSFDAKIDGDVEQGQTAWNSFGYHYALAGLPGVELEAMPLSSGVKISSIPVLQKKLVDMHAASAAAPEDEVFTFLVYPGAARGFDSIEGLKQTLTGESVAYQEFTATVKAGNSASAELELAAEGWTWESGTQYTIVEYPTGRDYSFNKFGTSSAVSHTFTYDPDRSISILCENLYRPWAISLSKVDDSDVALSGAVFALYSPNELDKLSSGAYEGLNVPLTTEVNQRTWYLAKLGTTDSAGKLDWTGLVEDSYYLLEVKAPDGYMLKDNPGEVILRTSSVNNVCSVKVINTAGKTLPHTGGAGTTPYTLGGMLLITAAAYLLVYNKKMLRRKEEWKAS